MGHKAVINIFLGGGPSHQDMWEIKTEAPKEIRGPFSPIDTNVPGIQIGECFPKIAQVMDKSVVLRAVVGCEGRHNSFQCMTGWRHAELRSVGGHPSIGSVLHKLHGPADKSVPPFVGMSTDGVWKDPGTPGFLGPTYAPFVPKGEGMADMKLNGITIDRLGDRKLLLRSIDRLRRDVDATGQITALDAYEERAFEVLTSSKLVDALDLSKEDPRLLERYDTSQFDIPPALYKKKNKNLLRQSPIALGKQLLMARRLIEADCRFVTVTSAGWDMHGNAFGIDDGMPLLGPAVDKAASAFLEDLEERGLSEKVLFVITGEFGRTPRINKKGGRDHWGNLCTLAFAGGGLPMGQVIGRSDRTASVPAGSVVTSANVLATIMHTLLDPGELRVAQGIPTDIVEAITQATPIPQLT